MEFLWRISKIRLFWFLIIDNTVLAYNDKLQKVERKKIGILRVNIFTFYSLLL